MKERCGKKWLIVHWAPTGNVPKEYDDDDDDIYDQKDHIYNHINNSFTIPSKKTATAFVNEAQEYDFIIMNSDDPIVQMNIVDARIQALLKRKCKNLNGIKFYIGFDIEMLQVDNGVEELRKFHFIVRAEAITQKSEINLALNSQKQIILQQIDRLANGGSGWTVHRIVRNFIHVNKYRPLRGSSYIPLPESIQNRKATINIQNKNDTKCFIYCLGRRFDPNPESKNLERVSKHLKKVCADLRFDHINCPVTTKDFPKIEKMFHITINVFGHSDGEIFIIYINGKMIDESKHINLLLTSKDEVNHYVWIKDFNKLNYRQTKHKEKKEFCYNCIQCFSSKEVLNKHKPDCVVLNGKQAVELPKEGSTIEFKSLNKTIPVPFVIYADCEALVKSLKKCENNKNENESYTIKTHEHKTCSYGYKVVCYENDKYSKPYRMFRGKDAIYDFFEALFEEEIEINHYMHEFSNSKMLLTKDDWKRYDQAKCCYVCKESFTDKNYKVRDHCHITNKFRGPACSRCNLQMKLTHIIPVIFHNLRGYDMHLLLQEVGRFKRELTIIPNNMEKYMSFSVGTVKKCYNHKTKDYDDKLRFDLRFIDSFQFMSSSLNNLVNDLKQGGMDQFKYMNQEFRQVFNENMELTERNGGKFTDEEIQEIIELLTRKGIYPYSYMNKWNKFDVSTKKLEMKHFRNDLTGDEISDEDFKFFKKVCKKLKIKTLGEYHDIYIMSDVLLLADVFENFRKTCLENYKLDPCHYYSAPGLAWDACLKMTNIKLELISDIDKYLFIEKGLRGGVSIITHRKATANNKNMKSFDEKKPSKHIAYFDANNLYGWAMVQSMPYGRFKWIEPEDFKLENVTNSSEKGHILEADIEYPKELHDLHSEYPFCPEQITVKSEMLSEYCKVIGAKNSDKCGKLTKLIPTLYNKEKYIIHERNLKQAVDAGLVLKKIHRVLEFEQKSWMKEYIDFNTEKRKLAKNDFEKNFFKLMNNSVFGKTMENVRKRKNFKLICDKTKFEKYVAKPTFLNGVIFNENLVGVHYVQEKLKLNKPIYVGFCILDISKTLMYDFHCNFIKNKYGDRARLLFTDTDSLCYEIETKNIYKDMYDNEEMFDLCDVKGKYSDNENKKFLVSLN